MVTRWRELGFMDDGGYGIPQSVAAAAARCLVNEGQSSFRHRQDITEPQLESYTRRD
jgi:hypothetical protein